jgi:hypothetical protein
MTVCRERLAVKRDYLMVYWKNIWSNTRGGKRCPMWIGAVALWLLKLPSW